MVECLTEKGDKKSKTQLEVDFVANRGSERIYVQSALSLAAPEKMQQEQQSFLRIGDSFRKVIIQRAYCKPWFTQDGIYVVCLEDFLLNRVNL